MQEPICSIFSTKTVFPEIDFFLRILNWYDMVHFMPLIPSIFQPVAEMAEMQNISVVL